MVAAATNTGDPMMTADGAASELPKLIDFIAERTRRSTETVKALLRTDFPHINGILTALPLSEVSGEMPKLVHYLGTALVMTPDEVEHMLQTDYPKIHQVIVNLPKVTAGWNTVPGTGSLARFNGAPVRTMPSSATTSARSWSAPLNASRATFGHWAPAAASGSWPPCCWGWASW